MCTRRRRCTRDGCLSGMSGMTGLCIVDDDGNDSLASLRRVGW